jgi:hypothetical protein
MKKQKKDFVDVGTALFKRHRFKDSIPYLEEATATYSDVEFPHMLGLAHFSKKEKDHNAAIGSLFDALDKPDATIYGGIANGVYKDLPRVLQSAGRAKEAEVSANITEILDRNPEAQINSSRLMDLQVTLTRMVFPKAQHG